MSTTKAGRRLPTLLRENYVGLDVHDQVVVEEWVADAEVEAASVALRNLQVDLHNASVVSVADEDAVLVSDIDAVIEDAIKELAS